MKKHLGYSPLNLVMHQNLSKTSMPSTCQDQFFANLIFWGGGGGQGVRAQSSGKTEGLRSIVVLPEG